MVLLKQHYKTTKGLIDGPSVEQKLRPYIGGSMLGHHCERYIWYTFRWCYHSYVSPRLLRLFSRGHREEIEIIKELKKIGIEVFGLQDEYITGHGFMKGHCDGKCKNVPEAPKTVHLLEIKTMSEKYFKELKIKGIQIAKPIYYGQANTYMYEYKLKRCLHITVNKNNDDLHIERLKLDKPYAEQLKARGIDILFSERPPAKRYKSTWYLCKWCDANDICHKNAPIRKTCRTCVYADMLDGGIWQCSFNEVSAKYPLTNAIQRRACSKYRQIDL